MKTPLHILNIHPLLAAGVVLGGCTGFTIVAAETPPQDNPAVLLRLQEQLDQQTKRIDRLYRALGPELEELEMLTGTESGALLVWNVAKGTSHTVGTNVGRQVDRVTWPGHDRVVWGSGNCSKATTTGW